MTTPNSSSVQDRRSSGRPRAEYMPSTDSSFMTPAYQARLRCALSELAEVGDDGGLTVDELAELLGVRDQSAYGVMSDLEWNGCERIPPRAGEYRWRIRIARDRREGTDREQRWGLPVPAPDWCAS